MSEDYGTINITTHVSPDAEYPERSYPTARWEGGERIVVNVRSLADMTTDYPQHASWQGDTVKLCQYTLRVVENRGEILICDRVWTKEFFGTRIDDCIPVQPGDYGRYEGEWWARCPAKGLSAARLSLHEVVEHDDKTISVSPSILMERNMGDPPVHYRWHGYLQHGVWRQVE